MAGNIVGSLRVLLGLDAAEFTAGLTKADYQAQKFARAMREEIGSSVRDVVKIIGGLEIGRQIYENTKAIISEAASLNDLADATGSSVESLSRLNNQAKIAGTDFATLQAAVLKLGTNMAGADEESTKAKEALRSLGITAKEPAEALQQIAVKLNTYADGVNKLGLLAAIFGAKLGPQMAATLKDIAELQDVGATQTAKQAAEAENLQKVWARLGVESQTFKNAILDSVVPALTTLIQTFNDTRKASDSFGVGLTSTLGLLGRSGSDAQQLAQLTDQIGKLKKELAQETPFKGLDNVRKFFDERLLSDLEAQRAAVEQRIRRSSRSQIEKDVAGVFGPKPEAPNPPAAGGARTIREQASETERYVQALLSQLQTTLDLSEVEKAQAVIYGLERNALSGLTEARRAEILDIAEQLDQAKEKKRVDDENKKNAETAARERERYLEMSRRSVETAQREVDSIRDSVEATREQIIEITQGREALDAYKAAKREKIALEYEDKAATAAAVGETDLAQKYRDAAVAIRELNAASSGLRIADDIRKQVEAIQNLKGQAFDAVSQPIADLIVNGGKASDVLKQLERNLVAFITNQAFLGIKNFALGGPGGGDLFSILLGSLGFGGGGGGAGIGGFSSALAGFVGGGTPSAGFAVVGENGPEVVQFSGRERVYSNADSQAMLGGSSVTVQQHFHVTGQVDSRTARQMAREASAAVSMARGRG